ncbi:MAG: DUF4202 domain-containing protein [Pseudomonadota bacterium]
MKPDPKRFAEAIARFDAANAEDPNRELSQGAEHPKELLYAKRMTAWLDRFAPDASEALKLAARSQHIRRWVIPRGEYPMNRQGYNAWRNTLAKFHAETAGRILQEVGYDEETVRRVESLLLKERIELDPEGQTLEDVICLVFLESYFAEFASHYSEPKLIGILRKTWKKMSPRGHEAALGILSKLPAELRAVVEKALEPV